MPFRRFFERRGAAHPVAYSAATLALGVVVCMAITTVVSVQASDRAVRQSLAQERRAEARAAEVERAARVRSQMTVCLVVRSMSEVYEEAPPTTPAGVRAAKAWTLLAKTFRCEER